MARVYCDVEECANHDGRDGCALEQVDLGRFIVLGESGWSRPEFPTCNDYEKGERVERPEEI